VEQPQLDHAGHRQAQPRGPSLAGRPQAVERALPQSLPVHQRRPALGVGPGR
jgi:hypothetical protein